MSRIGKQPITVPDGVTVNVANGEVQVKGPKGTLEHTIPENIGIELGEGEAVITRENDERQSKALHGLTRSLINNMVIGVSEGFRKDLEIIGVGYRANGQCWKPRSSTRFGWVDGSH